MVSHGETVVKEGDKRMRHKSITMAENDPNFCETHKFTDLRSSVTLKQGKKHKENYIKARHS